MQNIVPSVEPPGTFSAALDLLPSLSNLAEALDLPLSTVRAWRRRNSIPATYWDPVIIHARSCAVHTISYDLFRQYEANRWKSIQAKRSGRLARVAL
jgi:hypothetical protein